MEKNNIKTINAEKLDIDDTIARYLSISSKHTKLNIALDDAENELDSAVNTGDIELCSEYLHRHISKNFTDDTITLMCDIAQINYDILHVDMSLKDFIEIVDKIISINGIAVPKNAAIETDMLENFKKLEDTYDNRKDLLEKLTFI